jgi:hypothetical protein
MALRVTSNGVGKITPSVPIAVNSSGVACAVPIMTSLEPRSGLNLPTPPPLASLGSSGGSELDTPIGKADPGAAEGQPNLGCLLLIEGTTVVFERYDARPAGPGTFGQILLCPSEPAPCGAAMCGCHRSIPLRAELLCKPGGLCAACHPCRSCSDPPLIMPSPVDTLL